MSRNKKRDPLKPLSDAVNGFINGTKAATMAPAGGHAFANATKKTPSLYASVSAGPVLNGTAASPGPYITRIIWDQTPDTQGTLNPQLVDADTVVQNPAGPNSSTGIVGGDTHASEEPYVGIVMQPRSKMKTIKFAATYEWIFCGASPCIPIVGAFQKFGYGAPGFVVAYSGASQAEVTATAKTFFRLLLNNIAVTCWLPVNADAQTERTYSNNPFPSFVAGVRSNAVYQRTNVRSSLYPGGIVRAGFDQIEFWNAHQVEFVSIAPIIGRGGADITPRSF